MKAVETRKVRKLLRSKGCRVVGTAGSHEKWESPGGLSVPIVADTEQSPGVLRNVQAVFAPEFGEKWLEKELRR